MKLLLALISLYSIFGFSAAHRVRCNDNKHGIVVTLDFGRGGVVARDGTFARTHLSCEGSQNVCKEFPETVTMLNRFGYLWFGRHENVLVGFDSRRSVAFYFHPLVSVPVHTGIPCVYV